jgi:hypothetical protein
VCRPCDGVRRSGWHRVRSRAFPNILRRGFSENSATAHFSVARDREPLRTFFGGGSRRAGREGDSTIGDCGCRRTAVTVRRPGCRRSPPLCRRGSFCELARRSHSAVPHAPPARLRGSHSAASPPTRAPSARSRALRRRGVRSGAPQRALSRDAHRTAWALVRCFVETTLQTPARGLARGSRSRWTTPPRGLAGENRPYEYRDRDSYLPLTSAPNRQTTLPSRGTSI